MTDNEYDKIRTGKYKQMLRLCREYFLSPDYGCNWPDTANDISAYLARYPDKIENSVFKDCK